MARTNLPLTTMTPNSAVLNNAGTAIDATNGMNITFSSTSIPAAGGPDTLVLYAQNTTSTGTNKVTVRAGVGGGATPGAAFRSGLGDLVTGALTNSTGTAFVGPFDVSRFVQTDGSLNVDFTASMTGTIWAVLLPKRF